MLISLSEASGELKMKSNEIIAEGPWNTIKNLGHAVRYGKQEFSKRQQADRDAETPLSSANPMDHLDQLFKTGKMTKTAYDIAKGKLAADQAANDAKEKKGGTTTAGPFVPQEGQQLKSKNGDQYKFTKQRWTKYNPVTKKWNVVPVKPNPANPAAKTQSQLTAQAKRSADKKSQRASEKITPPTVPAAPTATPVTPVAPASTMAAPTTPATAPTTPKAGDPVPGMSSHVYSGEVGPTGKPKVIPAPAAPSTEPDAAPTTFPTKAKSKINPKDIDIDAVLKMADSLSPAEKKKMLQDLLKSDVKVKAGGA